VAGGVAGVAQEAGQRHEVAARLWEVATPIPHARRKARRRASP
jgi:hypothetical protein